MREVSPSPQLTNTQTQYLALSKEDGSVVVVEEQPTTIPSMLEIAHLTSSSGFNQRKLQLAQSSKQEAQDNFSMLARDTMFRPPSPILQQTEQSRIIDHEVAETIERIN